MVDITEEELTIIENAFVTIREAIDTSSNDPQAQQIMQQIVEAEQIVSAKLGGGDTGNASPGTSTDSQYVAENVPA